MGFDISDFNYLMWSEFFLSLLLKINNILWCWFNDFRFCSRCLLGFLFEKFFCVDFFDFFFDFSSFFFNFYEKRSRFLEYWRVLIQKTQKKSSEISLKTIKNLSQTTTRSFPMKLSKAPLAIPSKHTKLY